MALIWNNIASSSHRETWGGSFVHRDHCERRGRDQSCFGKTKVPCTIVFKFWKKLVYSESPQKEKFTRMSRTRSLFFPPSTQYPKIKQVPSHSPVGSCKAIINICWAAWDGMLLWAEVGTLGKSFLPPEAGGTLLLDCMAAFSRAEVPQARHTHRGLLEGGTASSMCLYCRWLAQKSVFGSASKGRKTTVKVEI